MDTQAKTIVTTLARQKKMLENAKKTLSPLALPSLAGSKGFECFKKELSKEVKTQLKGLKQEAVEKKTISECKKIKLIAFAVRDSKRQKESKYEEGAMGEVVGVADKRLLVSFYNNGRMCSEEVTKTYLNETPELGSKRVNPRSFNIDLYLNGKLVKHVAQGIEAKQKYDRRRLASTPYEQLLADLSDVKAL